MLLIFVLNVNQNVVVVVVSYCDKAVGIKTTNTIYSILPQW
jgi:hypothetical protein